MTRILAVDDSPSMRDMVRIALTSAGFDVTQATDGEEALALARSSSFDLILSDVNMPNMDGITLVRELRARPAYRYVPLLVLTTESTAQRKAEGKAAGATGWIVKPFNPERLIAVVARVIG